MACITLLAGMRGADTVRGVAPTPSIRKKNAVFRPARALTLRLVHHFATPARRKRLRSAKTVLLHIALSALAVSVAYLLATLIGSVTPVLAAGAALFSVHMNVTTSLSDGANRVAGTLLAVGTATLVEALMGVNVLTVGVIVGVTLFLARALRLGKDGAIGAAATGLFVLALGNALTAAAIQDRVIDTLLGVAIGILFSSLAHTVSPEEHAKEALEELSDEIGTLLDDLATGVQLGTYTPQEAQGWLQRSRDLVDKLAHASGIVTEAEVRHQWNPGKAPPEITALVRTLTALEHACAQVNGIARTLFDASHSASPRRVPSELSDVLAHTSAAFRVHADVLVDEENTQALRLAVEDVEAAKKSAMREVKSLDDTGVWLLSGSILGEVGKMMDGLEGSAPALQIPTQEGPRRWRLSALPKKDAAADVAKL